MVTSDKYLAEFSRIADEKQYRPKITARNVRELLLGKVDPQVIHVLEAVIEQDNLRREQIRDLAQLFAQCVDVVNQLQSVMGQFKIVVEKMPHFDPSKLFDRKEQE